MSIHGLWSLGTSSQTSISRQSTVITKSFLSILQVSLSPLLLCQVLALQCVIDTICERGTEKGKIHASGHTSEHASGGRGKERVKICRVPEAMKVRVLKLQACGVVSPKRPNYRSVQCKSCNIINNDKGVHTFKMQQQRHQRQPRADDLKR